MNIRYLQANLSDLSQNSLIKFLYDLIIRDISDIKNYESGIIYYKGDKVYLEENGKHQFYQCIAEYTSTTFIKEEWNYLLDVYEGPIDRIYNFQVKEEIHYIEEHNRTTIYTDLVFDDVFSTVAVYCGKKRYCINHDFVIHGSKITFNKPFNVGDRVIFEVRELIGDSLPSIYVVLYDLNGLPYAVNLRYDGTITIKEIEETDKSDIGYAELVTGDKTYTLFVDSGSKPYELKAYQKIETYITGTNNEIYKIEAIDDTLNLIECNYTAYSDIKYVLGLDNKYYTLSVDKNSGEIIAELANDVNLDPRNVEFGVRFFNNKFKHKVICINNGIISIRPYIDNGGYHNINFIDQYTGKIKRLTLSNDGILELLTGLDTEGYSGTKPLDYFYFFDDDWVYRRMFISDGLIYHEVCEPDIVPDSKGINILNKDGEMVKLSFSPSQNELVTLKCINLDNRGTFESPIEGFVMKVDGMTKLITINQKGDAFEIVDTKLPFRTNHHFLLSQDSKIYKLEIVDNQVKFKEYIDADDCVIECLTIGSYIKSYERISRVDIINNELIIHPISTFKHRLLHDGNVYMIDVTGEPHHETLTCTNIKQTVFDDTLGTGDLYIKTDNEAYIAKIDESGNIVFDRDIANGFVDYEITSLVQSSQGWYRIIIQNGDVRLEKMFDNMYEGTVISYGNLVKKSLNVQLNDGAWYSIAANGLGEVVLKPMTRVNVTGLALKSDDGYIYGLGMLEEQFTTYRTFIANPLVHERLYIHDPIEDVTHALFMKGSKLCSETLDTNNDATDYLIINDAYKNEFKIEMIESNLIVNPL